MTGRDTKTDFFRYVLSKLVVLGMFKTWFLGVFSHQAMFEVAMFIVDFYQPQTAVPMFPRALAALAW